MSDRSIGKGGDETNQNKSTTNASTDINEMSRKNGTNKLRSSMNKSVLMTPSVPIGDNKQLLYNP